MQGGPETYAPLANELPSDPSHAGSRRRPPGIAPAFRLANASPAPQVLRFFESPLGTAP